MTAGDRILAGDRLALARLLTQIEDEQPEGFETLSALFPHTGQAHLVGITGPPGTGKSTLVNRLALALRSRTQKMVGVVAVDPSSPFTGGAILGDRIRMRDLAGDPGIFIRSMASRGALGGLARTTAAVVDALDAAGFGWILIETVGAGQAEVEIARTAHTTLVVEAPGLGDDVQAIKAGILEAADLLVVNKADLPGADKTVSALEASLELASGADRATEHDGQPGQKAEEGWLPPVLQTVALLGEGIHEVMDAVLRHSAYLETTGRRVGRDRDRLRAEVLALLGDGLLAGFLREREDTDLGAELDRVFARQVSPRQAVQSLLSRSN
jgi:LAO/AO transport system kinase